MSGLSEILRRLPLLNGEEKRTLRQRLAGLLSLTGGVEDNDVGLVSNAILEHLRDQGEYCSYKMIRECLQFRAYSEKCPAVVKYFNGCKRIEKQLLLGIGVQLLHDNLSEMNIVVSYRTLMAHIHRLPACMNRAFPGYAASGHLKFIVNAKRDRRNKV